LEVALIMAERPVTNPQTGASGTAARDIIGCTPESRPVPWFFIACEIYVLIISSAKEILMIVRFRSLYAIASSLFLAATAMAQAEPPLDTLALWLKADAGVTTNESGGVIAWDDQSGNLNHAGQLDETLAPTVLPAAIGGNPAIHFRGQDGPDLPDHLEVPHSESLNNSADITSFFVVRFDDFATFRSVWGKSSVNLPAPTDYYVPPTTGLPILFRGDGSTHGNVGANRAVREDTFVVLGFGTEGETATHYINGQSAGGGQITAPIFDNGLPLRIGTRDDFGTRLRGDIAELLIYNSALSETDRNTVVNYLRTKYGILNNPPTVSITTPPDATSVAAPTNIVVTANPADDDGTITSVGFFVNGALIGTATSAPYSLPVSIETAGSYSFTVVATDDKDATTTSGAISVNATGESQVPPFTAPASLKLWTRGDAGITTNDVGEVTEWTDQSGNNNHAIQTDTFMAPILADLDGNPALRFDGEDDFLNVTHSESIAITGDVASFFVARFDDFAGFRAIWGKTAGNVPRPTDYYLVSGTGLPRAYRGGDPETGPINAFVDGASVIPANTTVMLGFQDAGPTLTHYLNGRPFGSGPMTIEPTDSGTDLKIGSRDDFGTRMKGEIAELLIFDAALSDEDLTNLRRYLGAKYNLPVILNANNAPGLEITAPAAAETIAAPTNVTITVAGTDPDGAIASVEILVDGVRLVLDTEAPYSANLLVGTSGAYRIDAIATDNFGARTTVSRTFSATRVDSLPVPADKLQLWLRADQGVTAQGGVVSAWADGSGNSNHAAQSNTVTAPMLVADAINGKAALRFDGVDDFLRVEHAPGLGAVEQISSFFVARFDNYAVYPVVWAKTAGNQPRPTDFYLLPDSGLPRLIRGGPAGLASVDGFEAPIDTVVMGFQHDGSTATHYLNGLENGTGPLTVSEGDVGSPLLIGTRGDLFTKMQGDIAEILIYSRAISEQERNSIHSYLRTKYGLPGGEPVGPAITTSRGTGDTVVFSWPVDAGNYQLEFVNEIGGTWAPVTEAVIVNGDQNTVTITADQTHRFYRLSQAQ
jgi:hypothetical protein